MQERQYWLGFAVCSGIGPARFKKLLLQFGSAKAAWEAPVEQLQTCRIGENTLSEFIDFRAEFDPQAYEQTLKKENVAYVLLTDEMYPALLKQIKNPPFVLFYKGNREILKQAEGPAAQSAAWVQNDKVINYIGVVGTRKITEYGRQVTETLTAQLVDAGCVIVSGLALGVDAQAHQTTLDHHGITIAVLGCGVDCPYPQENAPLYSEILKNSGLIVSEYALGVQPTKGSFLSRNRIIAGLSQGVVVTEGAAQSGSLTTAHEAFINGRKVFAVPGPINSSLSEGPYQLIKEGAMLITTAVDIFNELGIRNYALGRKKKMIKGETKEEQLIINLLTTEELSFDELVRRTTLDSSVVGMTLSLLEMKGTIYSTREGQFALKQ